jgi:hypothetical protein
MSVRRTEGRRNKRVLVAESIVKSIEELRREGAESTFNAILTQLRSKGILSNHRSLREYLDYLVTSGLLIVRSKPTRQPNIRSKQMYSVTSEGPSAEAGMKAMAFHGLNWAVPSQSSVEMRTDLEGVVRGRLDGGRLYASVEDTVVDSLARDRGKKGIELVLAYSAALLATKKVDRSYLMRRANERGIDQMMRELLDEIDYVFSSQKPRSEDLKSLFMIRKWHQSNHHYLLPRSRRPDWSLLSEDQLVDVLGKQLGMK